MAPPPSFRWAAGIPLGDVCKVEVFGTKDAEECRFLWPPTADEAFFGALRLQAESFARHAGGARLDGASGFDAAAALEARRARVISAGRRVVPSPDVGIGIAGYGMMGRAHAYAYTVAPVMRHLGHRPRLRVISGRDKEKVARAAAAYGFESWTDDWREMVTRPDVDIVDICTPPGTHAVIAARRPPRGKAVICEKPLAITYAQAERAVEAVSRAGVLSAVGFNYRRLPAVSLMKRMVDEGAIGTVRLMRATWLSDEFVDPAIPFDWRFDRAMGGSTIADLGSHLIDMATWMAGGIAEVSAPVGDLCARATGAAGVSGRRRFSRARALRFGRARRVRDGAHRGPAPMRLHGGAERRPRHAWFSNMPA